MREKKVAITAIYTPEEYTLHLRKGDRKRGAVGLIGFIGGEKEESETYREAAARELGEETTLQLPVEQFEPVSGVYKVISDRDNVPVIIWTKLFRLQLPFGVKIEATEPDIDEIVNIPTPDVVDHYLGTGKLTSATERAFTDYLLKDLVIMRNSNGAIHN